MGNGEIGYSTSDPLWVKECGKLPAEKSDRAVLERKGALGEELFHSLSESDSEKLDGRVLGHLFNKRYRTQNGSIQIFARREFFHQARICSVLLDSLPHPSMGHVCQDNHRHVRPAGNGD